MAISAVPWLAMVLPGSKERGQKSFKRGVDRWCEFTVDVESVITAALPELVGSLSGCHC